MSNDGKGPLTLIVSAAVKIWQEVDILSGDPGDTIPIVLGQTTGRHAEKYLEFL